MATQILIAATIIALILFGVQGLTLPKSYNTRGLAWVFIAVGAILAAAVIL